MLLERGFLYSSDEGWRLRDAQLPVPESVHAIIAARIDALTPNEKSVLRDASVIGRGFWPGAVVAVSGVAREIVEESLRSLERKELVRRLRASAVEGELQYSFHHALVRDVAYGQIPRAERAVRHRLAAQWIEALGRPEDHSETTAHHYLQALEYARRRRRVERMSSRPPRAQLFKMPVTALLCSARLRRQNASTRQLSSFGKTERMSTSSFALEAPASVRRVGARSFSSGAPSNSWPPETPSEPPRRK